MDGDPLDGGDPTGLDHCIPFTNICVGFHPSDAINPIVNIGRGASFGLSDRVANWLSPGASCTVGQNAGYQALGGAATAVATGGLLGAAGAAGDVAGTTVDIDQLSAEQLNNYTRFLQSLPKDADYPDITRLPGGSIQFNADVPGRVPGSYATYSKTVDPSGATTLYEKTTFDPSGSIANWKIKYP